MNIPTNERLRNKLVLAIKRRIVSSFIEADWNDLAYLTHDGHDIIVEHERLLRSLYFQDSDYGDNVTYVVQELITAHSENLDILLTHIDFHDWLKQNAPKDYAELFGYTNMLLEQTSKAAINNSADVERHISRIQSSIDRDPALAVGSIKELVESVLKTILTVNNEVVGKEDFTDLLKRVQKLLDLDPQSVNPNVKGAEIVKRTLSNLGQVIKGIDELRNLYGTGHGQVQSSSISPRHARLVVGAGASLAVFLMETHEHRVYTGKITPSKLP